MQLNLSPEMETFVKGLVERGRFTSTDDVMHNAMDRLRDQTDLAGIEPDDLKKLIDEGMDDIEHGRVAPLDMQAVMDKVRARLLEEKCQGATG
jgi:putative addiction module CopG family antidote